MNTDVEVWKKWTPKADISSKFYIEAIDNNTEGLFVKLKNDTDNKSITIVIDVIWFSYRAIPTKDYFKTVEFLKQQKALETWSLFEVEDSDYLKWVREESHGVYEHSDYKVKHYVFFGVNIVFEILMYEPDALETV